MIDLRSDTVTKPSPGMRAAMAAAEVGDDVFGEDPSVRALEEQAAALLGKEAALYVPSGSMANQVALLVHCRHGDDIIVGEGSHNVLYEAGAAGGIAGVQFTIVGTGGLFGPEDVTAAYKDPRNHGHAPSRLVCVENTHNRGGGRVWRPEQVAAVAAEARRLGLALHLDGARLLNAATALGVTAASLAAPFDSASLCFSKGLGAPVGSVFVGTRALVDGAHRYRKMLGGGMRQAGILAAAASYALTHNVARLAEDHANATRLAERLAAIPGLSIPAPVETNIVLVDLAPPLAPAARFVERLREAGVSCLPLGPRRLRLVTHLDVSARACDDAAAVFARVAAG